MYSMNTFDGFFFCCPCHTFFHILFCDECVIGCLFLKMWRYWSKMELASMHLSCDIPYCSLLISCIADEGWLLFLVYFKISITHTHIIIYYTYGHSHFMELIFEVVSMDICDTSCDDFPLSDSLGSWLQRCGSNSIIYT